MAPGLLTAHLLLDEVLDARAAQLGPHREAYRNHALRMLNFALALAPRAAVDAPGGEDKLAVAAAFHDLELFPEGTLDYLEPSAASARAWLAERGLSEWDEEVTLMILNHHKVRSYRGPAADLVEPFRKGDLVDVLMGRVRMGVPRDLVREAYSKLPSAGFHKALLKTTGRWWVHHPLRPAPILRW